MNRQDSLHEQMLDLIRIAEREGMYDAADWIKARWNMPRYRDYSLPEENGRRQPAISLASHTEPISSTTKGLGKSSRRR